MLHPVSLQCGNRTSRRYAGPQTCAPMSPPVGVLFRKIRLGCSTDKISNVAPNTTAVVLMALNVAVHSSRCEIFSSSRRSSSSMSSFFIFLHQCYKQKACHVECHMGNNGEAQSSRILSQQSENKCKRKQPWDFHWRKMYKSKDGSCRHQARDYA